jgi:hypothetical protein
MPVYVSQPIVVGDDVDLYLYVKKDGVVWNITGGTVLLYLRDPDGNWSAALSATIVSGSEGIARYSADETVFDQPGDWVKQWEVTVGTTTERTKAKKFTVEPWMP